MNYKMNYKINYKIREEEKNWIDYHLDIIISDKEKTYLSSGEALLSPVASKIFGFPWVEEVLVGPQRVSIKRQDWVDFEIIAEPLKDLLEEHFKGKNSGEIEENPEIDLMDSVKESPQVQEVHGVEGVQGTHGAETGAGAKETHGAGAKGAVSSTDLSKESLKITAFLEQQINPQVASHGGKISLLKYEKGTLYLEMKGGCQGCGMAQVTLREGVETALKENFAFVKEVIDATDHNQGLNPYIKN